MIRICCVMRGRNPDNPSDRRKGIELQQRIELNRRGIANCITTVTKDCLLLIQRGKNENYSVCKCSKYI